MCHCPSLSFFPSFFLQGVGVGVSDPQAIGPPHHPLSLSLSLCVSLCLSRSLFVCPPQIPHTKSISSKPSGPCCAWPLIPASIHQEMEPFHQGNGCDAPLAGRQAGRQGVTAYRKYSKPPVCRKLCRTGVCWTEAWQHDSRE